MRVTARLASLWKTMFRKAALDRELDDEIRATVQTLADRYLAAGMSPHAAERAALAALGGPGGILQVKEDVRDGRIGAGLESLLLDLRYAWRSLWSARRVSDRDRHHPRARHRRERRHLQRRACDAAPAAALSGRRPPRVRLARPDEPGLPAWTAVRSGPAEPSPRQHHLRRLRRHLGDRHGRIERRGRPRAAPLGARDRELLSGARRRERDRTHVPRGG